MSDPIRLDGQIAVVTGGAGGIGRAIVATLTRRGARCRIADLADPAAAIAALGGEGIAVDGETCDVASSADVNRFIARAEAELGRVDVLVNCAGGGTRAGFVETGDDEWFAQINVNLTGAFFMMRAVLPGMLARRHGAIVNVSSISGIIGGLPSRGAMGRSGPAYGAAKAGLIGLTKWAAREFGRQGVRVNAIAPGPVLTSAVMVGYDYGVDDYPIPRMGQPMDMAEAVAFLVSPAASYVTGEVLKVTGGTGM